MTQDLHFRDVTMSFGSRDARMVVLEELDLRIDAGEFFIIVGPSGCGKSTLMSMSAGLLKPSTGQVLLGGKPITGPGPEKAVVFQNFSLFPWKTVRENIEFGLRINGMGAEERRTLSSRYIELTGLQGFENHLPRQLSGGMQQRVAIARAFVMSPQVLLMDEPFAALDAQNRQIMQEELVRVWLKERPTVLFITHSVEEAVFLADRIVVMTRRPGRVKELVDVNAACAGEHWRTDSFDNVVTRPDFQQLRARIWGLIKGEIELH